MFAVNDQVVYPGHGVATITRVIERTIAGKSSKLYELSFLNKDMTVLVPVSNLENVGIRPLSSTDCVHDAFKILAKPARKINPHELTASNWNKRNKEYQLKIQKGDLLQMCEIYRDLKHISGTKELSFGEKALLNQIESLVVQEISLVEHEEHENALARLRASFANYEKSRRSSQRVA